MLRRRKKARAPDPTPVIETRGDPAASETSARIAQAFAIAAADEGKVRGCVKELPGMSGQRYRQFIHELVALTPDARYLEVGSWQGSTLCSVVDSNTVTAHAIDNWSEFGGPVAAFFANVGAMDLTRAKLSVTNADFRAVRWDALGQFNIYLFDGPHEAQDQHDGLALALPALDDEFVLIVDDWNWAKVRNGTVQAISSVGLDAMFSIEVRTTTNDFHPGDQGLAYNEASSWHNGYFLAALRKRR